MTARTTAGRPARVTVVGDTLLDVDWSGDVDRVCPDAPAPVLEQRDERLRPGGAGLAAMFAAGSGARVTLITALGDDAEGATVRSLLTDAGITVVDLGLAGPTPVKLRVRASGQSLVRVDRGCAPVARTGAWPDAATAAVQRADAVLVSDYGRGMAGQAAFAALLPSVEAPVVWDPHRRGPRPPHGLDLLVPNRDEAGILAGQPGDAAHDDQGLADELARRFGCAVALTLGGDGALVAEPGAAPVVVPVEPVAGDPCGAGDRFAAAAVVARAAGAPVVEAVTAAAAAARAHVGAADDGSWSVRPLPLGSPDVTPSTADKREQSPPESGGRRTRLGRAPAATFSPSVAATDAATDAVGLARAVRAAGGTVVVAGGCFDVLHAGHVQLLEAARRLGDCLIVCLNSDSSVRRLKGRRRPVNPAEDRSTMLRALGAVDAVHVFDEDEPCAALELLRPHLFVKGADYADAPLPEQQVLSRWGGEIVFVPVVPDRSTTRLLEIAAGRAG